MCAEAVAWDPRKAASNARQHGVRFADAHSVLEGERAITVPDDTGEEQRCVTTGMDRLVRVLTIVYTWRPTNGWFWVSLGGNVPSISTFAWAQGFGGRC
ncbi:MAG: BrnT family toxin [Bryobacterales bacterium]|nr:BrnT family toxin [Bryobacterales bacterium]